MKPDHQLVLAFYGRERDVSARNTVMTEIWSLGEDLGSRTSSRFTNCNGRFGSFRGLQDDKPYSLHSRLTDIESAIQESKATYLSLHSLTSEDASPAYDSSISVSVGREKEALARCDVVLAADYEHILGLDGLLKLAVDIVKITDGYLELSYGFAVSMPRMYCPSGYVVGLAGEGPVELVYDANLWRRKTRRRASQTLRNVYGVNFITSEHCGIQVSGLRLTEWIQRESAIRGEVLPFYGGLFVWQVTRPGYPEMLRWNNEVLQRVRNELVQERVFSWSELMD